jgi:hypothetical protein
LLAAAALALASMTTGCVKKARFNCSDSSECVSNGVLGSCEQVGFCSFPDLNCSEGGRRFGDSSGDFSGQCVGEMPDAGVDDAMVMHDAFPSACPIPSGAIHAWTLEIPVSGDHNVQSDVPYSVDNRPALASTAFTRVSYCLQLDTSFVYVELDDFTSGTLADIGIPTDNMFKVGVTNLSVRTNVATVTEITRATGGLIEMWPNCYSAGTNGVYDYDDAITTSGTDCYGSFQVHHETSTILAYNRWSSTGNADVGIGNQPAGNPDWTFSQLASTYTKRTLQGFILP